MNFLQLCQRTHDFSGLQGNFISVNNVKTGTHQALLVEAVKKSWIEIQNFRSDTEFARGVVDVTLEVGKTSYLVTDIFDNADDLRYWITDLFIYDNKPLLFVPYDSWVLQEEAEPNEPYKFSVEPGTNTLLFSPVDAEYVISVHYRSGINKLEDNLDVPTMPSQFHYLIVYGAVMEMAMFLGEMNLYNRYALLYAQMMGQMLRSEGPSRKVRIKPLV